MSQRRRSSSSSPGASRIRSIEPEIEPSGFRISWARAVATRPRAARRSARSARSVTSTRRPDSVASRRASQPDKSATTSSATSETMVG